MKEKLSGLDFIRFIAAIAVVAIHSFMRYDNFFDAYVINSIVRWAVPIFMIISGYFMKEDIKKFACFIIGILFQYIVWTIIYALILHINIWSPMSFIFGLRSGIIMPFWYFPTLLLSMVFVWCLNKIFKNPWIAVGIGTILYIMALIGNTWDNVAVLDPINNGLIMNLHRRIIGETSTRDGLFWATLYIALGYALRKTNADKLRISNYKRFIVFAIVSTILFVVEICLCVRFNLGEFDVFIMQIPVVLWIFILGLNTTMDASKSVFLRQAGNCIFIIHYLFLTNFMRFVGMGSLLFITTLFCSLVYASVCALLVRKWNILGYVLT